MLFIQGCEINVVCEEDTEKPLKSDVNNSTNELNSNDVMLERSNTDEALTLRKLQND